MGGVLNLKTGIGIKLKTELLLCKLNIPTSNFGATIVTVLKKIIIYLYLKYYIRLVLVHVLKYIVKVHVHVLEDLYKTSTCTCT